MAIDDLSFDIPKFGIFVLLGSNGYVFFFPSPYYIAFYFCSDRDLFD